MNTNNMTRDQAERVIERLVDGHVSFGNRERTAAEVDAFYKDIMNTSPIMLTDVLEKMKQQNKLSVFYNNVCSCWKDDCGCPSGKQVDHQAELLEFWHACGVTRSLQTTLQEAEWEHVCIGKCDEFTDGHMANDRARMKSPAKDLFEYIESLFPSNP